MPIQPIPVELVLLEVVLQDVGTILVLLPELDFQVVTLEDCQLMLCDEQLTDITLASSCMTLDTFASS